MKRLRSVISTIIPLFIILGLLYAGFFIKPKGSESSVALPPIQDRDRFYGIETPSEDVLWVVGSDGKILLSENNGDTWAIQQTPTILNLQSIAAWNSQQAVVVGNMGVILVTRNGGKTWLEVKDVPLSKIANKFLIVKAVADGSAWVVGQMGAILRTTDFGLTWTRMRDEEDVSWNDIFFIDKQGWVVGEFGRIMLSDDGGKSWRKTASPVDKSLTWWFLRTKKTGWQWDWTVSLLPHMTGATVGW